MPARVFLAALALFVFAGFSTARAADEIAPEETLIIVSKADGKAHTFQVELALDEAQRQQGLMFREYMPADHGMLFVFDSEEMRQFWMKNTLIPLDILFIKDNGKIISIHANAEPESLMPLPSAGPASRALELNGGTVLKLGIRPGDVVYNKRFFGNDAPE